VPARERARSDVSLAVYDGTMLWADVATARTSETGGTAMAWMNSAIDAQVGPAHLIVRRIGPADLRDGLGKGLDDFVAMIVAIFFVWLGAAMALDRLTLGRWVPIVGCGIGFLFDVGFATADRTSVRAVLANPMTMAMWGLFVAAALVIGSLPFLFGLAVVLPILGHSTWHLCRKVVAS
jgi:uncharacterized membrane protein